MTYRGLSALGRLQLSLLLTGATALSVILFTDPFMVHMAALEVGRPLNRERTYARGAPSMDHIARTVAFAAARQAVTRLVIT